MRIDNFVRLVASIGVVNVLFSGSLYANGMEKSGAKVASLMQKTLPDYPGKEGVVARHDRLAALHLHFNRAFQHMLNAGDTFYENPQNVHPLGRNVSNTKPAKLIVFFVKNQNAPLVLPPNKNWAP